MTCDKKNKGYRFSFGPWNIHEGADPFGPPVREPFGRDEKLGYYRELGFCGVQFHDDDAVPDLDNLDHAEIMEETRRTKKILDDERLEAEFVAPRLWERPDLADGAFTANAPQKRQYAIDRSLKAIDIARELGTRDIVLWLAREGTYIRESKDPRQATELIVEAIDTMLNYDHEIRILIEPKPNEPMDHAFIPTIGHALSLAYMTSDPDRVGGLIESAHCLLAGLDPSEEMGFALAHDKLWSVHLNDQNLLKFDQDKSFGSDNLRRAFNQVKVLEENDYGEHGEYVGLDVKVMRTQPRDISLKHLENSRKMFLILVDKVRTLDRKLVATYIENQDYEGLDYYLNRHLMGID